MDAVEVEPPVFEFSDPHDRLAEATKRSPHTTQIDVVLRCRTAEGDGHVVLIEVKLSETDCQRRSRKCRQRPARGGLERVPAMP